METRLSASASEYATAQAAHWRSFSRGLRLIKVGLCISLGTSIAMAALAPLVAVPDHIGFINDLDEILAFFLPLVAALGGIVGGILVLIGDWLDTNVPPVGDARRIALLTALAITAGFPLLLLSPLLDPLTTVVGGLATLLLTARNVLFLVLLMRIPVALRDAQVRPKILRLLIYWLGGGALVALACGILITGGIGASTTTGSMPQVGGDELLPGLPFFGLAAIVLVVFSSVLLWWLLRVIQDVRDRLPADGSDRVVAPRS